MIKQSFLHLLICYDYFFLLSSLIVGFIFDDVMVKGSPFLYSDKKDSQHALLIKILTFCEYSDYRTVLIYDDDRNNSIMRFPGNMENINVILHSLMEPLEKLKYTNARTHEIISQDRHFSYKIDVVAITIMHSYQITGILNALNLLELWNIMTPVFILNKSDKNCANAKRYFKITWRFDLISPYYLCVNDDEVLMIYTYNPYADVAPDPWEKVEVEDEWYMFKRTFHPEKSCDNLHFDRLKLLNGMNLYLGINQSYTSPENFGKFIATAITRALNVTLVEKRVSKLEEIKRLPLDLVLKTINRPFYPYVMTYPVIYSGNYAVSQNRGLLSPLEKISNFYGVITLTATMIILLITFVVILLSSGKNSSWFAFLEILRLLINSAIETKIHSLSSKIFFLMVFLYFLIIHATFDGNLAKFLTKPEFQKNIDSFKDLNDSLNDLKIFTGLDRSRSLSELLKNTRFEVRVGVSCVDNVVNDVSAVCIDDYLKVLKGAVDYNLHLSKKPIDTIKPLTFLVRKRWPVRERINNILMWIEHSGLFKVWSKILTNLTNTYDRKMQERADIPFQPITLDVLDFAFILLLGGLACAVVCFIAENLLILNKKRKRRYVQRKKMMRNIRKIDNTVIAVYRLQSRAKHKKLILT